MKQNDILQILLNEANQKQLDQLGQIHRYTKRYLLLAEELCEEGISFLQPLKEHRDAYDHLMRIFSLHLRTDELPEDFDCKSYVENNLKKAYGHEYRAFFDTADWMTFICRKNIREILSLKSKRAIYENKYNDYVKVKSFINEVPYKIAEYRNKKDISNVELLREVEQYKATLEELLSIYKKVQEL